MNDIVLSKEYAHLRLRAVYTVLIIIANFYNAFHKNLVTYHFPKSDISFLMDGLAILGDIYPGCVNGPGF
ncbi:hypothetical protein Q2T41_14280 [Maribacter confluentis]|uniref:Uncharacterized protein n=1 Tax=Maribacter confluentis TaxID=1656093 RepID=A0ABT8RSJ1_9FLAO|nr:hypothetical protein [Maribacter confluentis]MDO1513825.1 hypothetical protein [Maribacter confluentis]